MRLADLAEGPEYGILPALFAVLEVVFLIAEHQLQQLRHALVVSLVREHVKVQRNEFEDPRPEFEEGGHRRHGRNHTRTVAVQHLDIRQLLCLRDLERNRCEVTSEKVLAGAQVAHRRRRCFRVLAELVDDVVASFRERREGEEERLPQRRVSFLLAFGAWDAGVQDVENDVNARAPCTERMRILDLSVVGGSAEEEEMSDVGERARGVRILHEHVQDGQSDSLSERV